MAASLEDQLRRMTPVSAPDDQQSKVGELSRLLQAVHKQRQAPVCKLVGPGGESTEIPESVFRVLERVVEVLASGNAVTVVPVGKELTTQQAANLLNVSRQYLVRLLDQGEIPFRRTGKHRRLRVEDVLAYRERRDRARHAALDDLARLSEEAGGYSELEQD